MTAYAPLIKSIPFEQFHPLPGRENRFKYTESEDFFRSKSENEVEGRLLHRYSIASKPSYRKRKILRRARKKLRAMIVAPSVATSTTPPRLLRRA